MTVEPAKMSGLLVSSGVSWIKSTYGNELFDKSISKLTETERNQLKKMVLSIGWYDVSLFEKLCDVCYEEIKIKTGETRDTFDRRGTEEGGGSTLKTIYKFFLSITDPTNVLGRMPTLFKRTFSQGEVFVLKNEPCHCELKFKVPLEMTKMIKRNVKYGYPYLLSICGAKNIISQSEEMIIDGQLELKVVIKYTT